MATAQAAGTSTAVSPYANRASALPIDKTVLVVEDDLDVREEIERALDRFGYRVLGADHGAEALTILRREPLRPSLILLDMAEKYAINN